MAKKHWIESIPYHSTIVYQQKKNFNILFGKEMPFYLLLLIFIYHFIPFCVCTRFYLEIVYVVLVMVIHHITKQVKSGAYKFSWKRKEILQLLPGLEILKLKKCMGKKNKILPMLSVGFLNRRYTGFLVFQIFVNNFLLAFC